MPCYCVRGAANETRTRDPDLGKVVLYQLSYCRKMVFQPAVHHVNVIGNPLIAGAKVLLFLELASDFTVFFKKTLNFHKYRWIFHHELKCRMILSTTNYTN